MIDKTTKMLNNYAKQKKIYFKLKSIIEKRTSAQTVIPMETNIQGSRGEKIVTSLAFVPLKY